MRLIVIPCLFVVREAAGLGAGRHLVGAKERSARDAGWDGVAVVACAYGGDVAWFMPVALFEHLGYVEVERRGLEILLWKPFSPPAYRFALTPGKVAVDPFWNGFCPASAIEAQRVREVCAEFGDRVVLHERCAEDRAMRLRCQTPRGIYVNGSEIGWGYEAPRE